MGKGIVGCLHRLWKDLEDYTWFSLAHNDVSYANEERLDSGIVVLTRWVFDSFSHFHETLRIFCGKLLGQVGLWIFRDSGL